MLMKYLLLIILLSGCSSVSKRAAPDFSVAETRLDQAYKTADPETRKHLDEARKQIASAKELCLTNTEELEQAVRDRNDALSKASYWKEKQRKALKELWIWRGAMIVAVLFSLRGPLLWLARKFVGIPW